MITTALLGILNTLVGWFVSLRPVWSPTLPPSVSDILAFCKYYDDFLPIGASLAVLTLSGTLLTAMLTMKWGVKLVDWVRG